MSSEVTVTKKDIVNIVADKTGFTKESVMEVVNEVIEAISVSVIQNKRIEIRGFGVIEPSIRKQKKGYNFRTKDEVVIPEKRSVRFKTSKNLDLQLNS